MAVAVKKSPETAAPTMLSRLPAASLAGMIYVLASLGVMFYGLPWAWGTAIAPLFPAGLSFVNTAVLVLAMVAAAVGFVIAGIRLEGPHPPEGLKGGIFVALVGLYGVAQVTQWIGMILENWFYNHDVFGNSGALAGGAISAVIGLVLLYFSLRYFFDPRAEEICVQVENQGWFSTAFYKRSQGLRVRRGTILGILLVAGCGVYTLLNHGTLAAGPADWKFTVPFTGRVQVDRLGGTEVVNVKDPGDADFAADTLVSKKDFDAAVTRLENQDKRPPTRDRGGFTVERFAYRDLTIGENKNHEIRFVAIDNPGGSKFAKGQVVSQQEFDEEKARLAGLSAGAALVSPSLPGLGSLAGLASFGFFSAPVGQADAQGHVVHAGLTILPNVKYTLPIVLALLSLWLAFRLVNYPAFADFLIATEAEMNKVSWTTAKRLKQDTIVVLVTVVLLTVFLFVVDQLWAVVLKGVGVLRFDPTVQEKYDPKEQPW